MLRVSTGRVADGYAALAPEARGAMDREMIEFFRSYRKPDGKVRWPRKAVMIRASRPRADPGPEGQPDAKRHRRAGRLHGDGHSRRADQALTAAVMLPDGERSPDHRPTSASTWSSDSLAAILGGYVTARLSPQNPRNHVAALGGVILVLGLLSARAEGCRPAWFRFGIIGVGLAGAALGGLLLPWLLRKKA